MRLNDKTTYKETFANQEAMPEFMREHEKMMKT